MRASPGYNVEDLLDPPWNPGIPCGTGSTKGVGGILCCGVCRRKHLSCDFSCWTCSECSCNWTWFGCSQWMCLSTGNLDQALNELRNADQLREVQVAGPGPLEYFNETCSAFLGPSTQNYKSIRRHCESFHHRRSTCWRVCRGSSNTTFGARRTGPANPILKPVASISCQWVMNSHRRDDWRDWAFNPIPSPRPIIETKFEKNEFDFNIFNRSKCEYDYCMFYGVYISVYVIYIYIYKCLIIDIVYISNMLISKS